MPPETDNLRLEELFKEDQKDRERVYDTADAVAKLKERDRGRRKRVYAMIDMDEVATKNDLYHAAVILQHGEDPKDFLSAHRLSSLAAVMGHRTARWLMASSLDRLLVHQGKAQIYGTQFEYNAASKQYELRLPIEDQGLLQFEKEFLGVPSIQERLKQLNGRIGAA